MLYTDDNLTFSAILSIFMKKPALPSLRFTFSLSVLILLSGCQSFFVKQSQIEQLALQLEQQSEQIAKLTQTLKSSEQSQQQQQQLLSRQLQSDLKSYHQYQLQSIQHIQRRTATNSPVKSSNSKPEPRNLFADNKLVVGEIEPVFINKTGKTYPARIDSGAETSSIDARNIEHFERDGQQWVRFDMPLPEKEQSDDKKLMSVEHEVNRYVRIIQSNKEKAERRAVILLQFAIGPHYQEAEFTLSDRNHLSFPVLIGRNILRDVMLVDVAQQNITDIPTDLIGKPKKP